MAIAAALGSALCGWGAWAAPGGSPPRKAAFDGEPVSPVIFPEQALPLAFSHAQHLAGEGVHCELCHEGASGSRSSLDNLLPSEQQCARCHAIDRRQPEPPAAAGQPTGRCVACHRGYAAEQPVARAVIPPPNLKFSHRVHAQARVSCQTCHGDLEAEGVGLATRAQLPTMELCLACHDGRAAPAGCPTCHLAEPGGRIRTDYDAGRLEPSGSLRADAHTPLFRTSHAAVAQNDATYCESCHAKEFCVGCHSGAVKPLDFHGNDYVSLHAIEARRNQPDCSACHRAQTFCVACHSRTGVAYDGRGSEFRDPASGALGARFHPPGWAAFDGRGPDHHALEAQRNLRQCASCHREQFCTSCHSAEPSNPFRVDPHPAGWPASPRCRALRQRAGRMCLRCHIDEAETRCD
jgi:hypothetical protein